MVRVCLYACSLLEAVENTGKVGEVYKSGKVGTLKKYAGIGLCIHVGCREISRCYTRSESEKTIVYRRARGLWI